MYLNSENQYKEDKCSSNESNRIKSDTLDLLYKEQLTALRDLIIKKAQTHDIEICQKWLQVFSRTTKKEKIARNCLCTLMHRQMKESHCLQEPFTNLQNCDRDLECILCELDNQASGNLNSCLSDDTFQSHLCPAKVGDEIPFDSQEQNINTIVKFKSNELKTETTVLLQELKSLRIQLSERQIENVKLKEIAEKCRLERDELENNIENMKKCLLECLRIKLLDIENCGLIIRQFQLFQSIFSQFSTDKKFMDIVSKYDLDFQHILDSSLQREFNKRKLLMAHHICRKLVKTKSRLREKYERRLAEQTQTQKLQLELTKLKCFSILRQFLIDSCQESYKINTWETLKLFEEKYQKLLNID